MSKRVFKYFSIFLIAFGVFSQPVFAADTDSNTAQNLAYDEGFDPKDPMHIELLNILAGMPNMPALSMQMSDSQFFRPAFGPTLWRMLLKPNTMKVLFEGQDGTHIAEGAGYTATAGFGGRAQDVARWLGQRTGAGFMNYSFYTITKQYGSFDVPFLDRSNGQTQVRTSSFVDAQTWLLTQDKDSLMAQKRNELLDWIMRYHSKSLRLVVLFGAAARDSIGSLVESKNGQQGVKTSVGTRWSLEKLKQIEVPLGKLVSSGSNHTANVLLNKDGKDLYEILLGRPLDYKDESQKDFKLALKLLQEKIKEMESQLALTKGGLNGSGLVHPAQLGGFNLDEMQIGSRTGRSLEGLPLSDGTKAGKIYVVNSPHPTVLSKTEQEQGKAAVAKIIKEAFAGAKAYFDKEGHFEADEGVENNFAKGIDYDYGRTPIPVDYYADGTPGGRMKDKSDAFRLKPDVVVLGTRDQAAMIDSKEIESLRRALPGTVIDPTNLFNDRARTNDRFLSDRGPGPRYMKIIRALDMNKIGAVKSDMTAAQGIDAFYIKSHPNEGAYGHRRGPLKDSKVLILADPDGYDSWLTSRASTGARGQYLNALMEDMGVGDKYSVIQTVPFAMEGASQKDWDKVLELTNEYREQFIKAYLKDNIPDVIITDGTHAKQEMARIIGEKTGIPVVNIDKIGNANDSGIAAATKEIAKVSKFKSLEFHSRMANIPKSHLPYIAKVWWGTSGDRVLTATNQKFKGQAFAVVVPKWVTTQNAPLNEREVSNMEIMRERLVSSGMPNFRESVSDYYARRNSKADKVTVAPMVISSRQVLNSCPAFYAK